jgi:uncharacterized protein YndB with AHSA1/START domain
MNKAGFDPGPLADAQLAQDSEGWTLVFVRDLRHPPEKVWAALTDPRQLSEWSPFLADRDLGAPGDVTLTMVDGDHRENMEAVVSRAERPRFLEYTWATDVLRWELAPSGEGTRLTLRHTMQEPDWSAKVAAGWHLCLVVAEHLLDGQPIGPIRGMAAMDYGWEELRDAYATKMTAR